MINRDRAVAKFMEMVQIDSVSLNERGMADYLTKHFSELGYEVFEDIKPKDAVEGATAGNIVVRIPGRGSKANDDIIILESHMDTVEPGNGVKPSITADGKYVVSDGTTILGADDKAGIAQILEVVAVLAENDMDHAPLELVFAISEEIGLLGAFNVDTTKVHGKIAYVLDGGGGPGSAIIGGPDYYDVWGKITGKASHAGSAPDKGISSIQVMSDAISNMNLLKIDEDTTTNIGRVICNYPTNVVPEVTTFELEVRSLVPEKAEAQVQHVIDAIQTAADKYGAKAEIEYKKSLSAYHHTEDNKVLKLFKDMCEKHGLDYRTQVMRGGTDVSGLAENGIDAIALAAGGEYAHELRERLIIDEFIANTQQVLWLVTD